MGRQQWLCRLFSYLRFLVFLVSVVAGGDLLRSRYLVHQQVYPPTPKYFWFLMGAAVVALVLSAIVMQNWRYSSLVVLVVTIIAGSAIIGHKVSPNKDQT